MLSRMVLTEFRILNRRKSTSVLTFTFLSSVGSHPASRTSPRVIYLEGLRITRGLLTMSTHTLRPLGKLFVILYPNILSFEDTIKRSWAYWKIPKLYVNRSIRNV